MAASPLAAVRRGGKRVAASSARSARSARSAGLQTGIAPAGGETPIAHSPHGAAGNEDGAKLPGIAPAAGNEDGAKRNSPIDNPRMAHRAKGWRNATHTRNAGSSPGSAKERRHRRATQSSRWRKGTQAQERYAVLPVGHRSAGLQTGIARTAGETPIANPPHGAAGNQDGAKLAAARREAGKEVSIPARSAGRFGSGGPIPSLSTTETGPAVCPRSRTARPEVAFRAH